MMATNTKVKAGGAFQRIGAWAKKNPVLAGLIVGGVILLALLVRRRGGEDVTVSMPSESQSKAAEPAEPGAGLPGLPLPEMTPPELVPGVPIEFPSFPDFGGGFSGGGLSSYRPPAPASAPAFAPVAPTQSQYDLLLQQEIAKYEAKLAHDEVASGAGHLVGTRVVDIASGAEFKRGAFDTVAPARVVDIASGAEFKRGAFDTVAPARVVDIASGAEFKRGAFDTVAPARPQQQRADNVSTSAPRNVPLAGGTSLSSRQLSQVQSAVQSRQPAQPARRPARAV